MYGKPFIRRRVPGDICRSILSALEVGHVESTDHTVLLHPFPQ